MSRIAAVIVVTALTVVFASGVSLAATTRANIALVENGYEGILIAIAETVPHSTELIGRIKRFFTQASNDLFSATKNRVFFRNITILVPKSWDGSIAYETAKDETFSTANVVIDGPKADSPTTRTHAECGEPGEFIQIPAGYMNAKLSFITKNFGFPGPTIVHEWGHLRWGLRDEYPVTGYPWFYRDSDYEVTAVKCGKYMKGENVDFFTGKECTLEPETGMPTNSCYFKADHINPGVKASLMFYHNVTEVTTFCDNDPSDPDTLHNDEAPSEQNAMCDGKSAWEVMRQHSDFKDGNSPPIDRSKKTTTTFRIVQAKAQRVVLVLDVSGSMNNFTSGSTRLKQLRQAATGYLLRVVPTGYSVGIVSFSKTASIRQHLTKITSRTEREDLVNSLPRGASGNTAIGQGLNLGVEVLKEGDGSANGGILILVSDGKETHRPTITEVKPALVSNGVIVHTILISDKADPQLVDLAADTKGRSFIYSGSQDSTDLVSAFWSTITDNSDGTPGVVPVEMFLESVSVGANDEVLKSVAIDSSVGRDTEFTFSYTGATFPLDVLVTSPSGINFTADGPNSHDSQSAGQLTISLSSATEVGRWTILLTNRGSSVATTQLLVSSRAPTDDGYPIRTTAFLSQQEIDFNAPSTLKLIVRVKVMKGYDAITGAKVNVQVGSTQWKLMKDDGLGVDAAPDDGIYSAALLRFPANGRYPVKVRVAAEVGKTKLMVGGGSHAFRLRPVDGGLGPTFKTVEPFQRRADAGLVSVANLSPYTDFKAIYPFPAARVKNLQITKISFVENSVALQWTAVGDYEEQETASSYDFRFSTSIRELRNSFMNASTVNDTDIIAGDMNSPATPSEGETLVIRFPTGYENKTLFFGVQVNHSMGRISEVSNIVSAAVVFVPPVVIGTSTEVPVTTTTESTAVLPGSTGSSGSPGSPVTTASTGAPPTTVLHTTISESTGTSSGSTTTVKPGTGFFGLSASTLLAVEISVGVLVVLVIVLVVVCCVVRRRTSSRAQRSAPGDIYEMPSARRSVNRDYDTLQW